MTQSTIHGYRHLTETKVRMLAARYDLDPNCSDVRSNAAQADECHGQPCKGFDGNLTRFWGCDATGHYDAERLLDGYLSQTVWDSQCEARAARAFERQAY